MALSSLELRQSCTMAAWHQTKLVDPFAEIRATIPVGGEVTPDNELARRLADGIDGLFRTQVRDQYPRWPSGSTTDGCIAHLCWRPGDRELEVVGLTYLDFGGDMFPFRARFSFDHQRRTSVTEFVGRVDSTDASFPFVPSKSLFVPVRDEEVETISSVELIVGRIQLPVDWEKAVEWREPAGAS